MLFFTIYSTSIPGSLIATTCRSLRFNDALNTSLPIRPNPLIPTFVTIFFIVLFCLLVCCFCVVVLCVCCRRSVEEGRTKKGEKKKECWKMREGSGSMTKRTRESGSNEMK